MSDEAGKIIGLRTGQPLPPPGEPHEGTVALLKDMLERAESGEITGVAMAVMYKDGATQFAYDGLVNSPAVVGKIEIMKQDIIGRMR